MLPQKNVCDMSQTDENELDNSQSSVLSQESLILEKSVSNLSEDDIQNQDTHNKLPTSFNLVAIAIVVMAVFSVVIYNNKSETLPKKCDVYAMRLNYPNQDLLFWSSIKSGVESVLNKKPTIPSTFLFVSNNNDFDKFLKTITNIIHKCLGTTYKPTIISGNDFVLENDKVTNDYGIMISKYEPLLKNSGLLIVNDLNEIPVNYLPVFHVFCDLQNPLVHKAIIIFTLKMTNKNLTASNYSYAVEDYLREIWSESINNNILEPLITRITDQVLYLQ